MRLLCLILVLCSYQNNQSTNLTGALVAGFKGVRILGFVMSSKSLLGEVVGVHDQSIANYHFQSQYCMLSCHRELATSYIVTVHVFSYSM